MCIYAEPITGQQGPFCMHWTNWRGFSEYQVACLLDPEYTAHVSIAEYFLNHDLPLTLPQVTVSATSGPSPDVFPSSPQIN